MGDSDIDFGVDIVVGVVLGLVAFFGLNFVQSSFRPASFADALTLLPVGLLGPITALGTAPLLAAVAILLGLAAIVGSLSTENRLARVSVLALGLLGWLYLGVIGSMVA